MTVAASIREATLEVWRAQPSRVREDANAEEDAHRALGHRALVELVQNALDASPEGACVRIVVSREGSALRACIDWPLDAVETSSAWLREVLA